jgi:hypothetical protein
VGEWKDKDLQSTTVLNPGQTGTLAVTGSSPAADFGGLFKQACGTYKFAWIRNGKHVVTPNGTERHVTLPMPTKVHLAGFLKHGTVTNTGAACLQNNNVHPHITTIFEYAPKGQTAPQLDLQLPSQAAVHYGPGSQVIFRMMLKMPGCPDVPHVKEAFSFLVSRVNKAQPAPVAFGLLTTTDYTTGPCAKQFSDLELGLEHPTCPPYSGAAPSAVAMKTMSEPAASPCIMPHERYANCAGASIIVGG